MNNTLFPYLLFLIINSLQSSLPDRLLIDYLSETQVGFILILLLPDVSGTERSKTKRTVFGVKVWASHIQSGNQDSPLHIVRTHFIIWVIIAKLWILLPKFLLAVEFTSLIQHIEELLIPQAAFEAFSISQKTDVKEAPGESFFLYAGTYYIVFGS